MGGLGERPAPMERTRCQGMAACYRAVRAAEQQQGKYIETQTSR